MLQKRLPRGDHKHHGPLAVGELCSVSRQLDQSGFVATLPNPISSELGEWQWFNPFQAIPVQIDRAFM